MQDKQAIRMKHEFRFSGDRTSWNVFALQILNYFVFLSCRDLWGEHIWGQVSRWEYLKSYVHVDSCCEVNVINFVSTIEKLCIICIMPIEMKLSFVHTLWQGVLIMPIHIVIISLSSTKSFKLVIVVLTGVSLSIMEWQYHWPFNYRLKVSSMGVYWMSNGMS